MWALMRLHSRVEKNADIRYNFMSIGKEHKTNPNVYYREVSGGRKEKSLSSLGTTSRCLWGQICIPFKMCLISFCFPRLEAEIRNLFLYQLRSLIIYLQSYFINDRKGEK